jgi:hypothetical protein
LNAPLSLVGTPDRAQLAERQGWRMQNLMSQLESPIEQALVLAMMVRGFEHEPVPVGFLGLSDRRAVAAAILQRP